MLHWPLKPLSHKGCGLLVYELWSRGMLPSAVSLILADADAGQGAGCTSCPRPVERFYFSLIDSREVVLPQHPRAQHPSALFLPFVLENQSYSGLQPCVCWGFVFCKSCHICISCICASLSKMKRGLYEGS